MAGLQKHPDIGRGRLLHFAAMVFLCLFGLALPVNSSASVDIIQRPDGTLRRINVPILMYHYVSSIPPDADAIRVDLTVTPDMFRAHMQYLYDSGYQTISLYQLYDALISGEPLPFNPIILTFDDGYDDHYEQVFSILQELGFTGTFFIITGTADANAPGYLTWPQIAEMAEEGMSMESHSVAHLDMRGRDRNTLIHQIMDSLENIESHTGQTSAMFCYPAGHYDDTTLEVLHQLPVALAVTTQHGTRHTTDGRLELSRLRVRNTTDVAGLARLLHGSG